MEKFNWGIASLFVLSTALASAGNAWAQESSDGAAQVDEIIVTATKTGQQSLQKVPLAVTAFSQAAIESRGATALADLAAYTPGFTYTFNGPWSITSIRGIGTNNVFAGGDPSTTLQVDGVYYGRTTGANVDFLDVERVEILRGPQGTLYGRNAIGGTVNVITQDPGNELMGRLKLTVGENSLIRPEGTISGPLITDKLSASISARYSSRDGYIKNLMPGGHDLWDENRGSVRGKLKFTPSESLSIVLGADYTKADEYYNGYTVRLSPVVAPDGFNPGFYETAEDFPDQSVVEQWGTSAKITADLGGDTTLTSITAYRKSKMSLEADLDFTIFPIFHTRKFFEDQNQISQEFNLSGKSGGLEYVVGLFGFREHANSYFNASLGLPAFDFLLTQGIDSVTKSFAAFGQGSYALTDQFKVTGGIRYTIDKKTASNIYGAELFVPAGDPTNGLSTSVDQQPVGTGNIFNGQNTRHAFTPKFGIDYQANADTLVYASVTRGFKSGGYNLLVDPALLDTAEYGPEKVWAYEAGLKLRLPSVGGAFNLAGFYYDYKGLQVNQFVFSGGQVVQFVNNAKGAKLKGVEAELNLKPIPQFEIGGALAYLDTQYDGNFPAVTTFGGSATTDGNRLSDAPKWSGNAYAQLNFGVGSNAKGHLRGDASFKSKVYYSPDNNDVLGQKGRWLFNASLSIEHEPSGLEAGVRVVNLTKRQYIYGVYNAYSAAGQPGEPRNVRAFISYSF
ncbi:MAG: TonB-dependent receptor [Sphingomonadales bacterium]|nr:MAG: TonB-dependent receptor [Sphingomonadales bacterium]TNF03734.1 MAG: TonB-dependent receptor [Sphingomonadales bacterium]